VLTSNTYHDTLIIHLRGGDALEESEQTRWRPSPLPYNFYRDIIEQCTLKKLMIVTTPPKNGIMHPLINQFKRDYIVDIQHGEIIEDLSILINCTHLVFDFSTFRYTAALLNTNLKKVFISKFVERQKGIPLLNDINSDIGFTMPKIANCETYVYDYPEFVVKK